jgi:hypothetical protein
MPEISHYTTPQTFTLHGNLVITLNTVNFHTLDGRF